MMAMPPYARVVPLQSLLDLGGFLVHMQCKEGVPFRLFVLLLPIGRLPSSFCFCRRRR